MTLRVLAALRLIEANADEQQARTFIKSVAHIDAGPLALAAPGVIRFQITESDFQTARKALTTRYGKIDNSRAPGGSKGGQWAVAGSHFVVLSDTPIGRKSEGRHFIALVDNFHKETPAQMMRSLRQQMGAK